MKSDVAIIMPTYNGAKYLVRQIESILKSTYSDFVIYIRDDGSTDQTLEIIKDYIELYPNKIVLLSDEFGNIGVIKSIQILLEYCKAELYMLCDQDDIWTDDKIEKLTSHISCSQPSRPQLAYSDALVINEYDAIISRSFHKFQNIPIYYELTPQETLIQNYLTGCTIIINNSLKNLILPFPENTIMHDWWIGIAAKYFASIRYCEEPLTYYRLHQNNSVGAKNFGFMGISIIKRYLKNNMTKSSLQKIIDQASGIQKYGLCDDKYTNLKRDANEFLELVYGRPSISNCMLIFKYNKHDIVRKIGFTMSIIRHRLSSLGARNGGKE